MPYGPIIVSTSATLIVAANTRRKNLTIVNTSEGVPVYIGPDTAITTSNAIPLFETQTRDQDKISEGYLGPIYGIVSSGSANVRYWETTV